MNKSVKMALLFILVISNSCFGVGWPNFLNFKMNHNLKAVLCLMVSPIAICMLLNTAGNKYKKDPKAKDEHWYDNLATATSYGVAGGLACTTAYFVCLRPLNLQEMITKVVEDELPKLIEGMPQHQQIIVNQALKFIKKQ